MIKLLVIYFSALAIFTFFPTKVSTVTFYNLSKSIQFDIDLNSPAISVEKDFMDAAGTTNTISLPRKFAQLNDVVGKPYSPNKKTEVAVKSEIPQRVLDYSGKVRIDTAVNIVISGPIELRQGLALTDENRIEIHRENKGSVVEFGEVDIQKGTYAIQLSGNEGHICARLRGSRHDIVGEGCFALDRIKDLKKSTAKGPMLSLSRYQDALALSTRKDTAPIRSVATEKPTQVTEKYAEPVVDGKIETAAAQTVADPRRPRLNTRIIDFYDYDNPEAKALAVETTDSFAGSEDVHSTLITTMHSANHMPARVVANNATAGRGAVLPNRKALDALRKIAEDQGMIDPANADESGMIWGRAQSEGRSVAGASIEVEGQEGLKAIYLNEFYMPDPNLKATASHGLYAVVGVPEGEYSLRSTRGNTFMGFQNVSVRNKTLAVGDIDSTERRRPVRLTLYDMINKTSQDGVVTMQNYEEDIVLQGGQADVNIQDNGDTAYALVNPLNKRYMTAQYILNPNEDLYNFPLVPSDWVESILSQAKLQKKLQNKIVMGIGAQKPYQVQAIGSKSAQVIYFDSQGQVIEGNFGQAGGGFFILDPEEDVSEYAIQFAGEKSVRAVYMPATPNVLNIIQM